MSDIIVIQPDVNDVVVDEITNSITTASDGPQGPAGPTGPTGPTGPAGSSGVVAVTAPITNSGTSSSANIGISAGTTSAIGALQLTDSVASTSTTTAATPNSVKTAYDLANNQFMPFISTFYYRGPSPASAANNTAVVNTTYYTPFFVPVTTTFDRIAFRAGSGFSGSAVVRLGIYNTTAGKPNTVLLDAGTAAFSVANTPYAITINQQLTPGIYWLAANSQTAGTLNTYLGPAASNASAYIGHNFNSSMLTSVSAYSESSVTGAFTTAGTLANVITAAGIYAFLRAA